MSGHDKKATTFLRTLFIFRKTYMDRRTAFFTTTPIFLLQNADDFLLNVQKFWTKSQKKLSLDIWRLRIFVFLSYKRNVFFSSRCFNVQVDAVLKTPLKNKDKRPEVACSLSKNDQKRHFSRNLFLQKNPMDLWIQVLQPRQFFSEKKN